VKADLSRSVHLHVSWSLLSPSGEFRKKLHGADYSHGNQSVLHLSMRDAVEHRSSGSPDPVEEGAIRGACIDAWFPGAVGGKNW